MIKFSDLSILLSESYTRNYEILQLDRFFDQYFSSASKARSALDMRERCCTAQEIPSVLLALGRAELRAVFIAVINAVQSTFSPGLIQ